MQAKKKQEMEEARKEHKAAKPTKRSVRPRRKSTAGTDTSGKKGGYLLSRDSSTIGADGLNFSVRNGKRWNPGTIATKVESLIHEQKRKKNPTPSALYTLYLIHTLYTLYTLYRRYRRGTGHGANIE